VIESGNICAVVLDIEGTTSSLEFVKDQLFPFARRHITAYVREHESAVSEILDQVRGIEGNADLDTGQLIAVLLRWMDEDRKVSPLKTLQGMIWQSGFDSGELCAHFYDDAVRAIRLWNQRGVPIYIYSSGSIAAQKLLFSHTAYGDLTPLLSGYFDTTTGSKLESRSYRTIAASIGQPAALTLFLSDHALEIQAATSAGMQAVLVDRATAPGPAANGNTISSFDELAPAPAPRRTPPALARSYQVLTPHSVADYLAGHLDVAARLGGTSTQWHGREVGDGNLNLVFIVQGPRASVVVKQALPYVRLVGESWPLPLTRSHYEHLALVEQARWVARFVPAVLHADREMALIVMEYLAPHVVLRQGLIAGLRYPQVGKHLGEFLARTLYFTSDLFLSAEAKKRRIADFLGNAAMCKISEDLIFDEPYFDAPMNRHTRPQLDALIVALRRDARLKLAVQEMKWQFLNAPEALIHGDLHTGSVMVTADDTRVIDPEFAFYGPMGFDIGAIIGNLLMAYLAQPGHERQRGERERHGNYILDQLQALWAVFRDSFAQLWRQRQVGAAGGDVYQPRLQVDSPDLLPLAIESRLALIWHQSLGFAGCKMIRRIAGLAHIADFDAIADPDVRAACERNAVDLARELLLRRDRYASVQDVVTATRQYR
jgi:5-methylthioribose kinase